MWGVGVGGGRFHSCIEILIISSTLHHTEHYSVPKNSKSYYHEPVANTPMIVQIDLVCRCISTHLHKMNSNRIVLSSDNVMGG